jgi:hypothetical protein
MLRLPSYLQKSKNKGGPIEIPLFYKMSAGHVKFFYNKGLYLQRRHRDLRAEMERRGMKANLRLGMAMFNHYGMMGDWEPAEDAMRVNIERLCERINEMGSAPRYFGDPITREAAKALAKGVVIK